jgi:hypothetical protein
MEDFPFVGTVKGQDQAVHVILDESHAWLELSFYEIWGHGR